VASLWLVLDHGRLAPVVSPKLDGGWAGFHLAVLGHRNADRIRARMRKPLRIARLKRVLVTAVCALLFLAASDSVAELVYKSVFGE
jgi:hypothetical protein